MLIINFQELWDSHPLNQSPPENYPCKKADGTPAFDNQCAIKMSVSLMGANVNMNGCNKVKCWFGHRNHVIRAQELADWLEERRQLGAPTKFRKGRGVTESAFQQTVLDGISGKNGIIFCRNFWGTGNQGDHIDVWNGRVMGGSRDHNEYYGRSQQVWFWEITV